MPYPIFSSVPGGCGRALLLSTILHFVACQVPHHINLADGLGRLIINIGCDKDPPTPFLTGNPPQRVGVVAIEARPDTSSALEDVADRWVLTTAIAPHFGLASFNHFRDSSSLLEPRTDVAHWQAIKDKGKKGKAMIVPTIPMSYLLQSLSPQTFWFVKTDTQGMDLSVIKSAGDHLKQVHFVYSETWCNNYSTYLGAQNEFAQHWLPYMTYMGFLPVGGKGICDAMGVREINILWRNQMTTMLPPTKEECPKCFK